MTREQAIKELKEILPQTTAINMAIKALEQQQCEDWYDVPSDEMTLGQARQAVKDLRKMWAEHLEQEPCENAVSREAVEDIVMWYDGQGEMLDEIQKLPSVQPKQKTGHWIKTKEQDDAEPLILWKCSECHTLQRLKTKFCPNCGAKNHPSGWKKAKKINQKVTRYRLGVMMKIESENKE